MEKDYKKDLHRNYMVLEEQENSNAEEFCVKMLHHNHIEGYLNVEERWVDNHSKYYYDITAMQPITSIYEKKALCLSDIRKLFINILGIIEKGYEYLLNEDDILLSPEFIFQEVGKEDHFLCYLTGYRKNMIGQISRLIEYIMNKVDYNDREAVLLIYRLYAVSREEGFTHRHIKEALHTFSLDKRESDPITKEAPQEHQAKESVQVQPAILSIPVMKEKIEKEEEVFYYPFSTYLFTGAALLVGAVLFVLCIVSGFFNNAYGNRLEYDKLFGIIIILLCSEGYLLQKVWNKKHRITRIITKQEYIDPREEDCYNRQPEGYEQLPMKGKPEQELAGRALDKEEELLDNATCIINKVDDSMVRLEPEDHANYDVIYIKNSPFFIGKLKANMDYCLDSNTVSRYHAKISKEEGRYYLTDLNSTNGTYLNKEELQAYRTYEIESGDEISIADIKYQFFSQ